MCDLNMTEKELTEEEKQFLNKEIKIKYSDVLNYDPKNVPFPVGMGNWDKTNQPTEEYKNMMGELSMLMKYVAMKISEGCPEVKESMIKRCATLSVLLNDLVGNVAIDGWHAYGITSELHNNLYMSMSGKMKTLELLRTINTINQQKVKQKMGSAIV
jgi:hypothetical protein